MSKEILLFSKEKLKAIFKKEGIWPRKALGQNFLINSKIARKIIQALNLTPEDVVIEIGSGIGRLGFLVSKSAKKVIGIEKDEKLVKVAKKLFKAKNLEFKSEDILSFLKKQNLEGLKIVGNIPYYLTGKILRILLEREDLPKVIVLSLQKEVGERIISQPPKATLLGNILQYLAKVEIIEKKIPSNYFYPPPKVESILLKIEPKNRAFNSDKKVIKLMKAGFSHPRKTLIKNLKEKLNLKEEKIKAVFKECDLKETSRAQELTLPQWEKLKTKLEF